MINTFKSSWAIALASMLGACAATAVPPKTSAPPARQTATSPPARSSPAPQIVPAPSSGSFRAPRVMKVQGLDGVIGANAKNLQRQFGAARLDVMEGDARKLQFSGEACVLDIYLYPLREGAEPTATYVDARRASDGLDVDRAACVAALRR